MHWTVGRGLTGESCGDDTSGCAAFVPPNKQRSDKDDKNGFSSFVVDVLRKTQCLQVINTDTSSCSCSRAMTAEGVLRACRSERTLK